ncbi:MAG: transcriptional regulator [Actinomycetales bacterium]|nr:transcriptional regulator [Actinomycetales bacterium]
MNRELKERRGDAEAVWRYAVQARGSTSAARPEVFASWQRSAQAVSVDLALAPMVEPGVVTAQFAESRLGRASQVILDDLRELSADGDLVAALTDDTVTITWLSGGRRMRRNADAVNFTLGGCWSEGSVGTNALALAHELGRPATVFSAEHYAPMVHDWVCYSAPIIDPADGRSLGVIDVSSLWSKFNPSLLTMVRALARNVEYELARDPVAAVVVVSPEPRTELTLRVLGSSAVTVNGSPVRVSPRQLELLAILAMHDDGLSLDELTALLYGDQPISVTTVKAELSHLRQLVGGVIASRPYRLTGRVDADHARVLRTLASGDLNAALDLYRGSLLPSSQSPEITSWRYQIDVAIRNAVIRSRNPELLYRLSACCPDDGDVAELALMLMAADDVRRGVVAGRSRRY